MQRFYYEPDQAHNYYSEKRAVGELNVYGFGHSCPWPGYETKVMRRPRYALHFMKGGRFFYQGAIWEGPCLFLMTPEEPQWYRMTEDSPPAEQYWMLLAGDDVKETLENAGLPAVNAVYPCPYIDRVWEIFEDLCNLSNYDDAEDHHYTISALYRILAIHAKAVREATENISLRIRRVLDYIHRHYAESITESVLAEEASLSVNYMHRRFSTEIGMPPIQYLNQYRIGCAKQILRDSDVSIAQVAEMVGFPNPNYFCRVFQKHADGFSPTAYRKKHRLDRRKRK